MSHFINTDSSPHVCLPMYGGRCWCSPRTAQQIALDLGISRNLTLRGAVALLREIRGDNVVQFKPRHLRRSA